MADQLNAGRCVPASYDLCHLGPCHTVDEPQAEDNVRWGVFNCVDPGRYRRLRLLYLSRETGYIISDPVGFIGKAGSFQRSKQLLLRSKPFSQFHMME